MRGLYVPLLFFLLIVSCAPSGPVGHVYHNVAAHFNGYFYAKERIKEIETEIYNQHEWNYNAILPIFPQYDTTVAKSYQEKTEDCIKKASIAIQQHPNSRWEDDAYILVGKARLYACEFPEAIETFKYVNTNSEDKNAQHYALSILLRTFVEASEIKNAIAVSDYLEKQELSNTNKRRVYMTRAYLHQKREDYNQMVQNLVRAEELMDDVKEKARIDFIIGQVYQYLGFDANAYEYYKESLRKSPTYELSFFTKLNMAQVTQLTRNNSIKKVRKYFKKLLNDPKNLEYKDRIYYEMGDFSLKQGKLDEAIDHYKSSIQSSVSNNRQKAYAYHRLGVIYYDSLRNFPLAKAYYDSTISVLPKDEADYKQIKSRQEILEEFVQHLTTIEKNDSLLSLTNLPQDSLESYISFKVEQLKMQDQEQKKEQKRQERLAQRGGASTQANPFNEGPTISSDLSGTWYFYNASEKNRGIAEFKSTWGERPLEDNWRRSSKTQPSNAADTPDRIAQEEAASGSEEAGESEFDEDKIRQELLAGIPKDSATIAQLNSEIEEAYYQLGNIYNFKLEEKGNAISSFTSLLGRYPASDYTPEVLYQMYLLTKEPDSTASVPYTSKLIESYPESVYTKLVFNPNFKEESDALNEEFRGYYERAYKLYDIDSAAMTISLIDSVLSLTDEETDYSDHLRLLKAMAFGKEEGIYKYQYELNNFIKNNPQSDLVAYAEKLVQASEDYQINLYSSSRAKFVQYFEDKHYFILIYNPKPDLSSSLSKFVSNFISEKKMKLNTGNLVLDANNAMILVNDFPGRGTAKAFLSLFQESLGETDNFKGEKVYPLIITKDNFDILYETKDLESYLTFFEKNYL